VTAVAEERSLQQNFRGQLLHPDDEGYDAARAVWNGSIDRRPRLVARATGVADVVGAVNYARDNELLLAVRGGGHSLPGHSTCDDGLVLDLSPMQGVHVDPRRRRAVAQPGVLLGLLDRETQAYGLATTGGQISHTGIAGLTLGGGIGWLGRKFGLTCDNLVSADVVTASGELVTASEEENPELLWGLRGGGGNFGVVTSFEYDVHPLGLIFGGAVMYPAERSAEVLRHVREVCADAPDELTTLVVFQTAPPAPFLPQELHGRPVVAVAACYAGDLDEGAKVVEPLRSFGPPVADMFQPMPYTVLQSMFDASAPHYRKYYVKGHNISDLSDEVIDLLVSRAEAMPPPFSQLHVAQLGGAISRVDEDATAFSGRGAGWALIFISGWEGDEQKDKHVDWVRGGIDETLPHAVGAYVNFLDDEGLDRIKFAYGSVEKYERLLALKDQYDPANLFCLNQNIRTA
jgi:FAD/FMN-containing dehydrogenase